jgi:type II secretory pathway pseudopilin PulG
MKKNRCHFLTLIELMVVIVLIVSITAVLAYNVQGSIEKGKVVKTRQAAERLQEIISLEIAQGKTLEQFKKNRVGFLKDTGLIKNPEDFIKDGWGNAFEVKEENGELVVTSEHLKKIQQNETINKKK